MLSRCSLRKPTINTCLYKSPQQSLSTPSPVRTLSATGAKHGRSNEFIDLSYMNLSPQWIFNVISESFKPKACLLFFERSTQLCPSTLLFFSSVLPPSHLTQLPPPFPAHSSSPSLSTLPHSACSVALKYGALCRSADQCRALNPESECDVNDMIIPSKAPLTSPSRSILECKGWFGETMK